MKDSAKFNVSYKAQLSLWKLLAIVVVAVATGVMIAHKVNHTKAMTNMKAIMVTKM